jgi:cytochrome c biogenesis protein CcmG/thiol:disulfide interchange protein DsbE
MLPRLLRRAAVAAVAVLLVACGADDAAVAPDSPSPSAASSREALARLKTEANRILDGGPAGFKARLAELRGHPVVVNQWASWCGPCRFEFPFFRSQAGKHAGRVAFLGVNSKDSRDDAEAFLKELPVPFPHYYDKDASIARLFRGGRSWPTTAFYDASGELAFTQQGAYASEGKLAEDIRRYALRD